MPRTGLEPARLAAHAPETCASTNSATWAKKYERKTRLDALITLSSFCSPSGKRDSNSRPQPWQGCALPTELFPQESNLIRYPSIFQCLIYFSAIPLNCECKITTFWSNCQIILHFFNPFYHDNHHNYILLAVLLYHLCAQRQ